jgi:hypothetical protein
LPSPRPLPDRARADRACAPAPPAAAPELPAIAVTAGGLTSAEVARRTLASSASVRARQAEVEAASAKVDQTMIQFFPRLTLKATYTRLSSTSSDFGSGALVGAANPGLLTTGPCPGGVGTCVLDSAGVPVGAAAFSIETIHDNYALNAQLIGALSDYVLRLSTPPRLPASVRRSRARRAVQSAGRSRSITVGACLARGAAQKSERPSRR